MVDTTFYFTEWEVSGSFGLDRDPGRDRDELIEEALTEYVSSAEPVAVADEDKWYFGAPREYPNFLVGKFGKVYSDNAETYDEERGDFVELEEPNTEADYSFFILHFEYNLLIYNTKNRVGHQQFKKYFAQGFSDATDGSVEIEINFIKNDDEIERVIAEQPVMGAQAELEPSNPNSDPEWEELDNHIQQMLASKLEIDIDSKEGESLRVDEDLLEQILSMSQTRYGNLRVTYVDDGNTKVITTDSQDPITEHDERPSNIGAMREKAGELIEYARAFV